MKAIAFLRPLIQHLGSDGVGSESFDGDPPFTPRGCIAQALSVAEVLKAWKSIGRVSDTRSPCLGAEP